VICICTIQRSHILSISRCSLTRQIAESVIVLNVVLLILLPSRYALRQKDRRGKINMKVVGCIIQDLAA
jgi:hypothetical protein